LRGVWGNPSGFESRVAHSNLADFPYANRDLAVDLATMSDLDDEHENLPVTDFVQDAVVADPDPVVVAGTGELLAARWSRVRS